jgi:hypothetical protein
VFCQIATDPAVGAAKDADGISAGEPPVDAAKDIPAIPSTDTVLLGRFPLEARLACAIAEFLLHFPSTKSATNVLHPLALFCDAAVCVLHLVHVAQRLTGLVPRKGRG